jgi:hypothetical protein
MKQPVERRLAAILAADVAGYSPLMGADEEGTHERAFTIRRAALELGNAISTNISKAKLARHPKARSIASRPM